MFLGKWQKDFPENALGMDITFKRVVKTVKSAKSDGLNNLGTIYCNASGIDEVFGERELDGVVDFLPRSMVKKNAN